MNITYEDLGIGFSIRSAIKIGRGEVVSDITMLCYMVLWCGGVVVWLNMQRGFPTMLFST